MRSGVCPREANHGGEEAWRRDDQAEEKVLTQNLETFT